MSGQTVSRITFGFDVTLAGDAGDQLGISPPLLLSTGEGETYRIEEISSGLDFAPLLRLLGQVIVDSSVDEESTVILQFANGDQLKAFSRPDVESWELIKPNGSMVICGPGGTITTFPPRGA